MQRRFTHRLFVIALGLLVLTTQSLRAEQPSQSIQKFVTNQCVTCHEGESAEGGLDLTKLPTELSQPGVLANWMRIVDRVHDGEMPPPDAGDLKVTEREEFVKQISEWLRNFQNQQWKQVGRVQGRRLTNLQLERSLHHILGIDIPLANRMPEEPKSNGFTTVADGQSMSHFQLQQHLDIVDLALDEAFQRAIEEDNLKTKKFAAEQIARTNPNRRCREPEMIDGHAVTWSSRLIFYGRLPATTAKEDGWYRFTVRAKSLNTPEDYGVWCTVRTGRGVSSAPLLKWVGAFEATDETQEWTFDAWLPQGEMLEIRPGDDTLKMGRFAGGQVGTGEGGPQDLPGVAIESLTMERIRQGASEHSIREILFADLKIKPAKNWRYSQLISEDSRQDIERLMQQFAERAFRRPVEREVVAPFVSLVQQSIDDGESLMDALRAGYRSLLCSPRFLYFYEEPGQLDDYAIASRLSYLLWNAPPDNVLLNLAEQGKLQNNQTLQSQVDRMLDDPKGKEFIPDFAAQWLDLSEIDFTTPDRRLYPGFDVVVQESMVAETEHFLQTMLDQNQSITRLIDAEETFLNERLARYYGVEGVTGDEMRPVSFEPSDSRGGLMTQGAIMKVTANGTNTSPVIRGVWISERLLGQEIPPPPANVPAIEPDIRGAKTIREMLEKHKSNDSCASCHVKIDPPGFALENFDPAGRWRDRYIAYQGRKRVKGPEIDPSEVLPGGGEFHSLREFQKLIIANPEKLAGNLAENLLTYGTGAPVTFADRDDVEQIALQTQQDNFGFRSILKAVVTSDTFLTK
ncbi:MAG: DUF1592 domain-containing protein [Planctomycetaceae bacterium]|jgi:hypothetical protein|nr:DUF1592 domain-containing protein [Planctomycetaceae bacterium]